MRYVMFSCNVSLIFMDSIVIDSLYCCYMSWIKLLQWTTQYCIPLFQHTLQAEGWNCCCALASLYLKNYCKLNNNCNLSVYLLLFMSSLVGTMFEQCLVWLEQWCVSNSVAFKYVRCMNNAFHFYSQLEWFVRPNRIALELYVWVVEHKIYCNFKVSFTK